MSGDIPQTAGGALAAMAAGDLTAEALTEALLARISAPSSEGKTAFLRVDADGARAAARSSAGHSGPLAGLPIAVKDLFDIAGEVTTAGSRVLAGSDVASTDAAAVRLLRDAGAVVLGRTHMNEFAYSALGTNSHFPQPRAPWQREADNGRGRSPGGSTSGGAIAVADGLAYAALGSDTGGSTRIPAAFCGVTGWRPSQGRFPSEGAFPLAASFDTPGLIVRSVGDCLLLDAVLSGEYPNEEPLPAFGTLRLATAHGLPFEGLDAEVASAIGVALERLSASGAAIEPFDDFNWAAPGAALVAGQVTAVEALVAHGDLFEQRERYDPRVVKRMRAGEAVRATEYVGAIRHIADLRRRYDQATSRFDAVLMPTVAILPPRLAELVDDDVFFARNAKALRNTLIASILDLPAISLPVTRPGEPPVGLMMIGRRGGDRALLAAARTVESTLTGEA